jgi:HAE1 family hydrophobic/amphiphilic exporter-1
LAGKTRLRPILMTTLSLIMGMLPLALAFSEVGRFRQAMGIAIIGGLISSTALTLLVIPSLYEWVDDLRLWFRRLFRRPALRKLDIEELARAQAAPAQPPAEDAPAESEPQGLP